MVSSLIKGYWKVWESNVLPMVVAFAQGCPPRAHGTAQGFDKSNVSDVTLFVPGVELGSLGIRGVSVLGLGFKLWGL